MRLQRASVTQRHPSAFILIDSVRGSQHTPVGRWAGVGKPHIECWTEMGRGGEGDERGIDGGGNGVAAGSGAENEDGDVDGMGPHMGTSVGLGTLMELGLVPGTAPPPSCCPTAGAAATCAGAAGIPRGSSGSGAAAGGAGALPMPGGFPYGPTTHPGRSLRPPHLQRLSRAARWSSA